MDILKAEIEKKRKLLESKSLIQPQKKFFKRQELIQKFDEDYYRKQAEKYGLKQQSIADQQNEEQNRSRANSQEREESDSDQTSGPTTAERILPRKDVIKRLRERNEPIVLFGESEIEAFRRLRKLEILEPDSTDRGLRNDFQVWIHFCSVVWFASVPTFTTDLKNLNLFNGNCSDMKRIQNL